MNSFVFRALLIIGIGFAATSAALAQTPLRGSGGAPTDTGVVTLLTSPRITKIRLEGRAHLLGPSPLELPSWMSGRTSVTVVGVGVSRTQGVLYLPERSGERPTLASEPRGLSVGLIVRSLNFPGLPDISAGRLQRGLAFATAGIGAGVGAARSHLQYRDRLREFGGFAADRAEDERHQRNGWFTYGLAVWGASAVDYWIRPRFQLEDSDPTHAVLIPPPVTRAGIAWRSLLVPGAGQEFGNHSTRGTVWLGAFLAAGAGFTIADGAVHRRQTQLDWARILVDSAGPSERAMRLRDVEVRRNDLQTSEDVRRGFRIALFSVYAANVIDALVVPIRRAPDTGAPRLSAAFPVGQRRAGVTLNLRF